MESSVCMYLRPASYSLVLFCTHTTRIASRMLQSIAYAYHFLAMVHDYGIGSCMACWLSLLKGALDAATTLKFAIAGGVERRQVIQTA